MWERFVETTKSVFENPWSGSTGDPPVPSGDPPDGMGATVRAKEDGLCATWRSAVPVGGSPTGAGESPALPTFQTGSWTHLDGTTPGQVVCAAKQNMMDHNPEL